MEKRRSPAGVRDLASSRSSFAFCFRTACIPSERGLPYARMAEESDLGDGAAVGSGAALPPVPISPQLSPPLSVPPSPPLTWERIRHFHKDPDIIAGWVRALGPGLRWLTPPRRRFLLGMGALYVAVNRPLGDLRKTAKTMKFTPDLVGSILTVVLLFAFIWLCYQAARRFAALPKLIRRHPQISLHAVMWLLLIFIWTVKPTNLTARTALLGCVLMMPFLLWRIGYMMFTAQRGKMAATRFTDHLAYIYPLWRGTEVPYGKGYDYLSVNEARDEVSLARSQLAGIKLLVLAALWGFLADAMEGVVYGDDNYFRRALGGATLGLPRLGKLLEDPSRGTVLQSWLAIYLDLFRVVLNHASYGHVIIGMLRLFGFNVFRNTYKPLLAESVVEFWNRYYYYFKELMVTFFFYPTFTRYFKQSPRLRLFASVFMAAFVGNMYYHLIGLNRAMATADFSGLWGSLQSRLMYCLLLTLGIYISMRRQQARPALTPAVAGTSDGTQKTARRVLAIFGVWTFFSIIHIWMQGPVPFMGRMRFFFGLLGLS